MIPQIMTAANHSENQVQIAKDIHAIRREKDELEVYIEWDGLPAEADRSWEPIGVVREDLPGVLEDYLHTEGDRDLKRLALQQLF